MEFLQGATLKDYIECHGKAELKDGLGIIVQILRALDYIHSRNIVYRDIKPKNIMIYNGSVKMLDFGISAFTEKGEDRSIRGTISYLSPDIFTGGLSLSSDFFSLGLVIFEIFAGIPFFDPDKVDNHEILRIISEKKSYKDYFHDRTQLIESKDLEKILPKMMAFSPEDRYQTGSEIIIDINKYLGMDFECETKETMQSYVLGNSFADRRDEIKRLKEILLSINDTSMLIYRGASGVGKTRLLSEFRKYCVLNNISFFDSSCIEGATKPYYSIHDIIDQIVALGSDELQSRYSRCLGLILGRQESEYAGYLEDPATRKDIINRDISDYILQYARESGNPVIICINDMQWLDEGSAGIINSLLGKMAGHDGLIKIAANINTDEIKPNSYIQVMLSHEKTIMSDLYPLELSGVKEYVYNVFGRDFIDEGLENSIEIINQKVGGNPLFLGELIKSLLESGRIAKDRHCWILTGPLKDDDIPSNLKDIIESRVEILMAEKGKREILTAISLLRIDFSIDFAKYLLMDMGGYDAARILLELERFEIIKGGFAEDKIAYILNSSLIKDIIKSFIGDIEGQSLYIAGALEGYYENQPQYYEEIAYHYHKGKNHEKAALFYEKSADYASANYFNQKAVEFYDIALDLRPHGSETKLEINLKKTKALEITGNWSKAFQLLSESIPLAERIKDWAVLCRVYNQLGHILLKQGDFTRSKDCFDRSYDLSGPLQDKTIFAESIYNFAVYNHKVYEYKTALRYYRLYLKLCRENKYSRGVLTALSQIGHIYFMLADYSKAISYYEQFRKLAESIGDKSGIATIMGNKGNAYFNRGEYEKALECYQGQYKFLLETGCIEGMARVAGNIGIVFKLLGEIDKAMEYQKIFMNASRELGDQISYSMAVNNIGSLYKRKGEFNKALEYYLTGLAISRQTGDKSSFATSVGNIGFLYHILGEYDKAIEYLEQYVRIAGEMGQKSRKAAAVYDIADIYMETEQYDRAIRKYFTAIELFKEIEDMREAGNVLNSIANIYFTRKDYEKAQIYFTSPGKYLRGLKKNPWKQSTQ